MKRGILLALLILAALCWCALVWFIGPLIGIAGRYPFDPVWSRALLCALVVLGLAGWGLLDWLRRRRAARALEVAILDAPAGGDGQVLAERMQGALAVLKKSNGAATALYDLPWYVIIGPPGAGKTTALVNSGIRFPLSETGQGAVAGIGGTRYCDWWFSEEAVLIDTAGRYTSQDSDAAADKASWASFLGLLKKHRPKQPLNGVLLAFSVEDMLTATPESLTRHAETVRLRLAEVHEALKVDFPVYVMFTKADLIAGFREFFDRIGAERRKGVWGATFQTRARSEQTHLQVKAEFDALVARLSEEVVDRLAEEQDETARIAIFGFPAQVALLRDRVDQFLAKVFEPTRYKSNAMLRGFYFTSGTQEGTPIDQMLGALQRQLGTAAQGAFLSGKGRSYFLHDLLARVVFPEAGWVSYDRGAVRRSAGLRLAGYALIGLVSLGLAGLWAASTLKNRGEVAQTDMALRSFEAAAGEDLARTELADVDFQRVANQLQILRAEVEATARPAGLLEGMGLGQRDSLHLATREAYRAALERLLRPRLILYAEEQLDSFTRANDPMAVYGALKVYLLLGGLAPTPEDGLVRAWMQTELEQRLYRGAGNQALRAMILEQLEDLLRLDGEGQQLSIGLNGELLHEARLVVRRMKAADRAWSLLRAGVQGVSDVTLQEAAGPDLARVFETVDGSPLEEIVIPGLFTHAGFHDYFLPELALVGDRLRAEDWMLRDPQDPGDTARGEMDLGRVGPDLMVLYREAFLAHWGGMLDRLRFAPLLADRPNYVALNAAASAATSPVVRLTERIARETRLSEAPSLPESGTGAAAAVLEAGVALGQQQLRQRATGWAGIGLNFLQDAQKSQNRPGGGGSPAALPGADIEAIFAPYRQLVDPGPNGRPIDSLLRAFASIQENLVIAAGTGQTVSSAQMMALVGQLRLEASRLPEPYRRMIETLVRTLEGDAATATLAEINAALATEVSRSCQQIESRYPFARNARDRQVPLAEFAMLFGGGGVLERFFNSYLADHVLLESDWSWKPDSPLAQASVQSLRQFQRADRIRQAFFPGGSQQVDLKVTITQIALHAEAESAILEINGQRLITRQTGNTPQSLQWPGTGASAMLQLLPEMANRRSTLAYQGPWAFLQFIRDGRPRAQGDVMLVDHILDGRNVSYQMRVESLYNPFLLGDLFDFRCPAGL